MNALCKTPTIFFLLFFLPFTTVNSQSFDTLRIMSYNLTNYGNNIDACTATNNGPGLKNPWFKTVAKHVMPDILGVCEMNTNPAFANNFLNNVLNTDGVNYYRKSNHQAESFGTLMSVLYYNSQRLVLARQSFATTSPRLTHYYRLYVKTSELANGDTVWINVLVGHLKAGNTPADATERAGAATVIRNFLNNLPRKENCVFMGDFNLYRSSENAFQILTAANPGPAYQFQDPVNRVGSWGSNSTYSDVHTQCPSTNVNTGCYSGGGLDDRFDFILMNKHILFDSAGMRYIPGTYKALGNDGNHYNKNITDSPVNNSAPSTVLQALHKASDHLPVVAQLRIAGTFLPTSLKKVRSSEFHLQRHDRHWLVTGLEDGTLVRLVYTDASGRVLWEGDQRVENSVLDLTANLQTSGLIFVRALAENRKISFTKFLNVKE